ncbi:MAG TPA: pitrilysin family protein [Longimicrobiales bacterium]|nr:pitrilysin family protein [Longimicrobiales bacterium]
MTLPVSIPCQAFTLDNGLRVLVHQDHAVPIASVNVWYHVGSRDEQPGRTGIAHLFEHLMFEGSRHVPTGQFDRLLEEQGAVNNGSTTVDRTNYWETLPAHALELALFLEADRMGGLLSALTEDRFLAQRDVVRNERRQSFENRPYGMASELIAHALYAPGHPYRWPTIGYMGDLDAVSFADARAFGATWYAPRNATLAVAGDVDVAHVERLVRRWFETIPPGPVPPPAPVAQPARHRHGAVLTHEDDVRLARLYRAWHSPPMFAPGDAALDVAATILAQGRASRLEHALVHERELAQSVMCYQASAQLGSSLRLVITARPGVSLDLLDAEAGAILGTLAGDGPTDIELERARNGLETTFVDALQAVGGFGGRADRLNSYLFFTGDPGYAAADLERYRSLTRDDVAAALAACLAPGGVRLDVVPRAMSAADAA